MVDKKIENEIEKQQKSAKKVEIDEKNEIDLKELQIKLEKIRAYIVKTESRIKRQESQLTEMRQKMAEIESKRNNVAVNNRSKLERNV